MERIELARADITTERVDAIVNAANPYLTNGSGVAGAIRVAAGKAFQDECDRLVSELGPLAVGTDAVATDGYDMPCRYVIHVVGPVWGQQDEERSAGLLAAAHRAALEMALELEARSVSFPAISTGIFGYPLEPAAEVALRTVLEQIPKLRSLRLVRFVLFDERSLHAHEQALERLAAGEPSSPAAS